jgi:DNA-binding transcriptional MerR regulator
MTTEEQDAVIGRMVRERKALDERLIAIRHELHSIGLTLEELGKQLQMPGPDFVLTSKQSKALNAEEITTLVNDLKQTLALFKRLRDELEKIGL